MSKIRKIETYKIPKPRSYIKTDKHQLC